MANQRVYIKCKCGTTKLLAKHFADGFEIFDEKSLNLFFKEHQFCGDDHELQNHFTLEYEIKRPKP